jgi:hypothetical protein
MSDTRFDYPVFSEGELITSEKLNRLATYIRRTLLQWFRDQYRGRQSGLPRSGVLAGFDVTPSSSEAMKLYVGSGMGLTWKVDIQTGLITGVPVVIEEYAKSITLDDPDLTNPRWDLIVLRPNEYYDEYAQRSVRNKDGTLTVQNLPGIMNADAQIVVIKGTPGDPPQVPQAQIGDIVVAAVYVQAGSPHKIESDDIYDTRIYLADTEATQFEYNCVVQGAANNSYTIAHESTSTRNIRISESMHKIQVGGIRAMLQIPRTLGSHFRELIDTTSLVSYGIIHASLMLHQTGAVFAYSTVLGWSESTKPYLQLELDIGFYDANRQLIDLGNTQLCYVRAVFPRVD